MATERLSMHKTREILRLKLALGRSHRKAARSLGIGAATVADAMRRARFAGLLDWEQVCALSDEELTARLYGRADHTRPRPLPDPVWIHTERRKPSVTLALLHLEYREQHPNGYGYTQFCEHYRSWLRRRRLSMRQVHRAGEKTFVDYAGHKPSIVDAKTGEVVEVELFLAVLGASNYTFAEAARTQQSHDWIASNTRAVEFFGGVTELFVPDQLRSAVTVPCRYEPGVQRTYEDWAQHYGTTVLPARPRKPRDKAKVEVGVQVAERWILARLRNEVFHTLDALNSRIAELLDDLNDRTMRTYRTSRRELYQRLDRPALRPLPNERFVYAQWKQAKLNIDYHFALDGHLYSAPFALVHEVLDVRYTASTVEALHRGQRVAAHPRCYRPGGYSTVAEHLPKAHREHAAWTPTRLIRWAQKSGPKVGELVEAILQDRPHPEQGYRSCLGLMRLARKYGDARLDAACARALAGRARSYRHVESILRHGLDRVAPSDTTTPPPIDHENVRGPDYYN